MTSKVEIERLLAQSEKDAIELGYALLDQEGFGSNSNPQRALNKAIDWLTKHHDDIQNSICCSPKIIGYCHSGSSSQELAETIGSILSDMTIFHGLPISSLSNIIIKKGIRTYCGL